MRVYTICRSELGWAQAIPSPLQQAFRECRTPPSSSVREARGCLATRGMVSNCRNIRSPRKPWSYAKCLVRMEGFDVSHDSWVLRRDITTKPLVAYEDFFGSQQPRRNHPDIYSVLQKEAFQKKLDSFIGENGKHSVVGLSDNRRTSKVSVPRGEREEAGARHDGVEDPSVLKTASKSASDSNARCPWREHSTHVLTAPSIIYNVGGCCPLMTNDDSNPLFLLFSRGRYTTVRLRSHMSHFPTFSESTIKTLF